MSTQKQIEDLLNDDWQVSSSNVNKGSKIKQKQKDSYEQSYANGTQEFDEYSQSKKSSSHYQASQIEPPPPPPTSSQSMMKKKKNEEQNAPPVIKITEVKEEKPVVQKEKQETKNTVKQSQHQQSNFKPAFDLKPSFYHKKQKDEVKKNDKVYLAHNYSRLEEREKELLFTSVVEQNKKLKIELAEKNSALSNVQTKYKILLSQKTENTATVKQLALEKKVTMLKTKLEQVLNLQKITSEQQRYKTMLSKHPESFVSEEQVQIREQQLLNMIDKLKSRLIQSDENMGVLQKKLTQGSEYNDELHMKMRRVEQLEFKLEKMTEQAETDRGYIDILKEKIKTGEKQLEKEKNKYRKLELQLKRMEMAQYTHSDLLKQLQQTKKEKALLEKSLKEMSSTMMSNVRRNYQNAPKSKIEDSGELLEPEQD